MNIKKILYSVASAGAVAALAFYATGAFFSDEETSVGNTFQAGAIDLKVDATAHYAGLVCSIAGTWVEDEFGPANNTWADLLGDPCDLSWELTDLNNEARFFNYEDLKPGDEGESTISLHVDNNDAWACVTINPTLNDDMSSTEPELEVPGEVEDNDSIFDGELAQNMLFEVWADVCDGTTDEGSNNLDAVPGDNIYQDGCDNPLTSGTGPITPTTWALADSENNNVFSGDPNDPLTGAQTYYLGVAWGIPDEVGNIIQTDKYMADISFEAVQTRNNPDFVCAPRQEEGPTVLRLENENIVEGGPWEVIVDDKYVDMTYSESGPNFDYSLVAHGLPASTTYALIYYADGWPGNNPGALLGIHATDGSGTFTVPGGSVNLNMDLPHPDDGNYAVGAKIWLVLASDYNNGAASTGPMTAWNPSEYLFEGNVYIHYDDTNAP